MYFPYPMQMESWYATFTYAIIINFVTQAFHHFGPIRTSPGEYIKYAFSPAHIPIHIESRRGGTIFVYSLEIISLESASY